MVKITLIAFCSTWYIDWLIDWFVISLISGHQSFDCCLFGHPLHCIWFYQHFQDPFGRCSYDLQLSVKIVPSFTSRHRYLIAWTAFSIRWIRIPICIWIYQVRLVGVGLDSHNFKVLKFLEPLLEWFDISSPFSIWKWICMNLLWKYLTLLTEILIHSVQWNSNSPVVCSFT